MKERIPTSIAIALLMQQNMSDTCAHEVNIFHHILQEAKQNTLTASCCERVLLRCNGYQNSFFKIA